MEIRNSVIWKQGNVETGKQGNMKIGRQRNRDVWKYGNIEITNYGMWKHRNMENNVKMCSTNIDFA